MLSGHNGTKIELTDIRSHNHRNRFGMISKSTFDWIPEEPVVFQGALSDIASLCSHLLFYVIIGVCQFIIRNRLQLFYLRCIQLQLF